LTKLSTADPALLNLIAAFVDEAGHFGAGLGADGAWTAKSLQALSSVVTPLVNAAALLMPPGAQANIGTNGAVKFDERGSIGRNQGGARIDLEDADYDAVIQDDAGNVLFGVMGRKVFGPRFTAEMGNERLTVSYFNGVTIDFGKHDYDVAIADPQGHVLAGWMNGAFYGPGKSGDDAALDAQDAANKAYSQSVYMRRITTVQRPTSPYVLLCVYGQSLAQGDETWPALSRTNRFGNLMLGDSVQYLGGGVNTTTGTFLPVGGADVLKPLVAVTFSNNSTFVDAAGEAQLAPGNGARGEPINHGWANGARYALGQYLLNEDYASRRFVSINVAVSGATIGELGKNHTEGGSESYGRYTSAITKVKAIASAEGKAVTVGAVGYLQGEHDYQQASGHNSLNRTYATYRAKFEAMIANMQGDAISITGQALPPLFLTYQTSGSYTRDVDGDGVPGLHVGMAQLDAVLANRATTAMVGPAYPYTDKGGHLDSNGSRWFGHQFAKVYHQVAVEGRAWEPLRPIKITKSGTSTIYVSYHVPFGPLVFDEPQMSGGAEYSSPTKGFRLTDDAGAIPIAEVSIVRDTIIRITTTRPIGANARVWYASQGQTNPGNGMVRDSDPAVAYDNYVYEPERGMYPTANIPQFVNKPYPLWNWSVAFFLPVA
ncbi:hypothetical protein, partial [Sphingomonas sp. 3-13AW]|uniref:hypothetical protein n=1 Tax=Sphingomonas sp. 3-13AW TaxID=3050450 RepID=UPI003BB6330B